MYDDAVMAYAIAIVTTVTEGPLVYEFVKEHEQTNDLFDKPPWEAVI
jgi:hypothetical protein